MKYLVRKTLTGSAHYWNGTNSFCKMYATGGMKKSKYIVSTQKHGLPICTMCNNNIKKEDNHKYLDI